MDIAGASIDKPVNTWLIVAICVIGGLWGLMTVPRLEDPNFTIKNAIIFTPYPGATAAEVEEEVTEHIESALQQLPQLKEVTSKSTPGMSEVKVEMKDTYDARTIPQVWDELRRKVRDVQSSLPQSAGPSRVNDDFGDVFGLFYAVTAPDFSDREIRNMATFLRRELLTVPDVAKVETAGELSEAIYVEVTNERLASLGIPLDQVIRTLQAENSITPAGAITVDGRRVRVSTDPGFDTVSQIEALRLGRPGSTEQISLLDVAKVTREPVEIPDHMIWIDGQRAFTLAIAGVKHANIVDVGEAVENRLDELRQQLPLGVELHPIYEQHKVVNEAIDNFILNLILSVSIVIGVLCIFMGWRVGIVVGITLLLSVLGTFLFMRLFGIEVERISLGALVIAMGMLVDNAIVVAEGMLVNMQRGMAARPAAQQAVTRTQWPLLGATLIGVAAFSGIGLSNDVTGEFMFSLFFVIAVSLTLSWVLAVTVTPMFGNMLLQAGNGNAEADPYDNAAAHGYRSLLNRMLRARWLCVAGFIGVTLGCIGLFGFVPQSFFAAANTPIFYLDYQLPEGTDIRTTAHDLLEIESYVREQPGVAQVTTLAGRGATRFMLTYDPHQPDPSYGQLMVRMDDRDDIPALTRSLRKTLGERYPDAQIRTKRIVFGPPSDARIEVRFSGHSPETLRALGDKAIAILQKNGDIIDIRQNWRNKELTIRPVFNEERARIAGITRTDLARAMRFATDGIKAGTYREGERQIPIVVRPPNKERLDVSRLEDRLVSGSGEATYVPVTQIVDRFEFVPQDTVIRRRDRIRTLTVQAQPRGEITASQARNEVLEQIEAIELPPGYSVNWGGEYENSKEAQGSFASQLPIGLTAMLIISILMFGKIRQPLIIWLLIPMSICGVTLGLLVSGLSFSFVALLGFISLWGMLMKNAIVLIDEIDQQIDSGKEKHAALIDASISRLRPVFLASVTTILGMIPLLTDAFFANMAVTIMGGLAFATVLTLAAVPVLYSLFFRIRYEKDTGAQAAS